MRQRIVIGRDRTGIAQCPQILARIEAEAGRIPQMPGLHTIQRASVRLRRIFQYRQPVKPRDGANLRQVTGRPAVQVHDDDRLRAWRDGRFHLGRIHAPAARQGLDRYRRGSRVADRQPGGNIGVAGHDHLVARADAPGMQHQVQRLQPVAHRHTVLHPAVRRKGALEGRGLLAQQHPAAVEHPLEGIAERQPVTVVDAFQVQEGDGGGGAHGGVSSGMHRSGLLFRWAYLSGDAR